MKASNYNEIPDIVDVKYLRGHDLLVSFSNGEERIIDMANSFNIPAAYRYSPLIFFKNFEFDKFGISWGDRESSDSMEIGKDSIYIMSVPIDVFTSSVFLSMGLVDRRSSPYAAVMRIKGDEFEDPHVHIIFKGKEYQVRLSDGLIMKPAVKSNMLSKFQEWIFSERKKAVDMWNKWNPQAIADPETGLRI